MYKVHKVDACRDIKAFEVNLHSRDTPFTICYKGRDGFETWSFFELDI